MSKIFVLALMFFCHIVDDYYLQGVLASMKQKGWWEKNSPGKLYRYDYLMALSMHGLSWSFMTMLPIAVFCHFQPPWIFWSYLIINCGFHCIIDHEKANLHKINLITDQLLHFTQIILTWALLIQIV